MNFERGKDIHDALDIGIIKSIKDIIYKNITEVPNFRPNQTIRFIIIRDIINFTGWKVEDISNISDNFYLLELKCTDTKNDIIRIITANMKNPEELL